MFSTNSRRVPLPLAQLLGLTELDRAYGSAKCSPSDAHFIDRIIEALRITIDFDDKELDYIPKQGPTIIISNHPLGALDGLVACSLALRRHSNVRVLANQWLSQIPEMRPWLLAVEVFGNRANPLGNVPALKSAIEHLRQDGLLVLFPAGIVSHWQPGRQGIVDPPWHRLVAVLARKTRAAVVPLYFEARNTWVFQVAGLIHPLLRTALLPRELLRRRASRLKVSIGHAVSSNAIAAFADDVALTAWLRLRTYDLARHKKAQATRRYQSESVGLVGNVSPSAIVDELSRLSSEAVLVSQGPYRVYSAPAAAIPRTLIEIGRIRELTFRAVGEGTGSALDIDRFDSKYQQLF